MDKDMIAEDILTSLKLIRKEYGETLKIEKNSRGRNWEIKLVCVDDERVDQAMVDRMKKIDDMLTKGFESGMIDPEPGFRDKKSFGSPYGFSEEHA